MASFGMDYRLSALIQKRELVFGLVQPTHLLLLVDIYLSIHYVLPE